MTHSPPPSLSALDMSFELRLHLSANYHKPTHCTGSSNVESRCSISWEVAFSSSSWCTGAVLGDILIPEFHCPSPWPREDP